MEEKSKEEILELSRQENKKSGDERQKERMKWSNYVGFVVTMSAALIVLIVKMILNEQWTELLVIIYSGVAAQNIAQAIVLEQKKLRPLFIFTAVLISLVAIFYWVEWILALCGIKI